MPYNKSPKNIHRIAVITPNYPMPNFAERGMFVEKLVYDWQKIGVLSDVIAPLSLSHKARYKYNSRNSIAVSGERIVRPFYFSFSNKRFGPLDFNAMSRKRFIDAALDGLKQISVPDLYYGKFLLRGGIAALKAGQIFCRPAFADMGESNFLSALNDKSKHLAEKAISLLNGIVCVSPRLRQEVISLGGDPSKILLLGNTADTQRFKPIHKGTCRQKLGLPQEAFIVAFTGRFSERKGAHRVLQAIEMFNEHEVVGTFFGRGPLKPSGERVLHAAPVLNANLPTWLNAADVFVLPTTAEGHCNSINEAIACGLPIISSDIDDVKQQLPEGCGVLVNPLDINAIYRAIRTLYEDRGELNRLSANCKQIAASIFSENRGAKIYEWLNSRLPSYKLPAKS